MSFLKKITEAGVSFAESRSEKRNLTLTNSISLIVSAAPLILTAATVIFYTNDVLLISRLLGSTVLFILPLALNRFGFTTASRIALCWMPTCIVFALPILDIHEGSPMSASSFVGLRLFLVTLGCFPFLVFNIRDLARLSVGLAGPLIGLIFFDKIFTFFDAAYWQRSAYDPLYAFNDVRALVAFTAISLSCFFLKRIVEQNEMLNETLLKELEEKNKLIREQADNDVHQLNQQLIKNYDELQGREFILNQSQKIAKIGSWEYRIKDAWLFCSDEVYNIFGLDKSYDFQTQNLSDIILKEDSEVLTFSTDSLLKTGQSFDITLRAKTPLGHTKWIRIYGFAVKEETKVVGARGICHDITYYREAEELLRTSENRYRSLFEQATDFIFITDFNGQMLDVNDSMCTAFQYTRRELRQLRIEQLIDPDELKNRPIKYAELRRGDHILTERRMMRKDRSIIVVEANIRKLQDDMILVIARDLTNLRQAEKQIAISEALFRSAFEYSAIGMALVSTYHEYLQVNRELCEITGYSESELIGKRVMDITFADDMSEHLVMNGRLMRGEIDSFQMEKRYIHKNGSLVWANVNASLVKDGLGSPLYLIAQIEDITDEKAAREKLVLSQANLAATINNTDVFIWSVDRALNLLMFNEAFFKYIRKQYNIELKLGTKVFGSSSPEADLIYDNWNPRFARVFNGEAFKLEETRFGINFQYSLSPIIERGAVIGASVISDNITEQKVRDRELAEANKKIGELKLMALRAVMSPHFIFNVLNSIQYYITKSDRYNAINYLSMFSRLIRTILTQSVDNKIRLSDEIEMLGNYIRLEMTRFENKFNFLLTVDPKVEADSVMIPSLLIQPYVENAILHGLYNKTEKGTLRIHIRQEEEIIVFEIEDDGIGRAAAQTLRERNFPAHKSMGIRLTEERLKLINQEQPTELQIEDLSAGDRPAGTRVTIRITA